MMHLKYSLRFWASAALLALPFASAIDIDVDSPESIKEAAGKVAKTLRGNYTGDNPGDVPGNLPEPYFWWLAGAMFGGFVDYSHYTGDNQYDDITMQALLHQVGEDQNYMPQNQTRTEGNDDQFFYVSSALAAAEFKFEDPPEDEPQWLALSQAVFNGQASRWDTEHCGGGLRWQIFPFNNGYDYKNTVSNGGFFQLAARLGKYTGNATYLEWAETAYDWTRQVGLITEDFKFYDGIRYTESCSSFDKLQWSYNPALFLYGSAVMWNVTNDDKWRTRVQGILDNLDIFISPEVPNVLYEHACEAIDTCNEDQRSFKGYLARWMGKTMLVAPWTSDFIVPILQASAKGAAAQCSGPPDGTTCGLHWYKSEYDGNAGIGEQLAALEVIQANLAQRAPAPVSQDTGGTSKGDAAAGSAGSSAPEVKLDSITTADKAGAGFITAAVLITFIGGTWWMLK